jgi:predicted GNAT family acetyltransferase
LQDNQDVAENTNITMGREELNGVHEFVLRIDGKRMGSLEFTRPDAGVLRIEYVEVTPELRGTGLGRQLVQAAVDWARETDQKVIPICSYARMVIQRDPAMSAQLQ